nr:LysR substrate-binding domain-containing protein [Sphingobium nicotianae]
MRSFSTLAECRNFGRAAEKLHVAQSALSLQVKQLEEELGVRLLNRYKRAAVTLTDAGELFLVEAHAVLRQAERAHRIAQLVGRGEIGRVDLGYVASAAICGVLPNALRKFRDLFPRADVKVYAMDTPSQLKAVVDGLIDVAIIRPRPDYPDDVLTRVIHQEPLRVALAASNSLARQKFIPPEALVNEHFIAPQFDEEAGFADLLRQLGSLAGTDMKPFHKVADFITAMSMAAAGYGVVLIPESFQRVTVDGLVFREVEGYNERASLVVAYRRFEPSPSVKAFVSALDEIKS